MTHASAKALVLHDRHISVHQWKTYSCTNLLRSSFTIDRYSRHCFTGMAHSATQEGTVMCRGVICLLRVVDGIVKKGDKVIASSSGEIYDVLEVRNQSHWCMVRRLIAYQNQYEAMMLHKVIAVTSTSTKYDAFCCCGHCCHHRYHHSVIATTWS